MKVISSNPAGAFIIFNFTKYFKTYLLSNIIRLGNSKQVKVFWWCSFIHIDIDLKAVDFKRLKIISFVIHPCLGKFKTESYTACKFRSAKLTLYNTISFTIIKWNFNSRYGFSDVCLNFLVNSCVVCKW